MKAPRNTISIVALPDEQYLLEQIAQGDEPAFRKVFEAYRRPLYAYIIYLIKSEVLADEIIQDVFLRVWLNRLMLREVRNFRAWLYTIAKNRIIDVIKLRAKEALLMETAPDPVLNCEAEDRIREKEYASLLHEAISQLSPKQQLIYQLSREKGLKLNEIAVKLNLSSNTVKSHLMHALRTIRKYVQPHLHVILAILLLYKFFKKKSGSALTLFRHF
ncbi:MAG: RNA polymerase sigma-70 factor [Chitinophagaceae bacterium]|nr:RNA polymerase sigma-70 factor [Chitinophagaceae bacterium]